MCSKVKKEMAEFLSRVVMEIKTVRNFFEMINFSNYFNMISDRGKHPMSGSCCGSSEYVP